MTNGPWLLTMMYRLIIGDATMSVLNTFGDMPPLFVATTRLPPCLATAINLLLLTLLRLFARNYLLMTRSRATLGRPRHLM